jgi:NlpC/P60 family
VEGRDHSQAMRKVKLNSLPNRAGKLASVIQIVCVVLCTVVLSAIRLGASPQEPASVPRLLTSVEGMAIVNAALVYEQQARGKPDCSHLVHQIYLLAGIDYPYASSFDLYAGGENFRRVRSPQVGDLIVWPGHVGIVLDPAQHTFYSSVHSGLQAEFYDGPYWRARGRPRFYRYVVESPGSPAVGGAQTASLTRETPTQHIAVPVSGERSVGLSSASKQPRKTASVAIAWAVGTTTATAQDTAIEIPPSILIATGQKQPKREEIAEAISELNNTAGKVLLADDPLKPRLAVVIYDDFDVERIEIKRDHGWAHVRLNSRVSIADGRAELNQRRDEARWELRRTESGWVALTPAERAYLPRDVAVRILAAQLAHLTQSDGTSNHEDRPVRQEAQLAALLDNLLNSR